MSKEKLTDEQIIYNLERYLDEETNEQALNLINRLKEERDRYKQELDDTVSMNEMYVKQVKENAKLKADNERLINRCEDLQLGKCNLECDIVKLKNKETAKEILITAIQLSDMCRDFYEFQNRLVDLIEINYGVKVERKTIIPAKQFGVEIKE